jgi:hypothetical protein
LDSSFVLNTHERKNHLLCVSDHPAAIITQSATYNSISTFFSGSEIFLEKAGTRLQQVLILFQVLLKLALKCMFILNIHTRKAQEKLNVVLPFDILFHQSRSKLALFMMILLIDWNSNRL